MSRWVRFRCFVLGHAWAPFAIHNPLMFHLGPTAGVDAVCLRCKKISWWGGQRYDV